MSLAPGETGRGLIRSSVLNALGQGLPLVAAVIAVPILVARLGTERVGLLTIGWALIGYFGVFDLGLGRALTQLVSERGMRDRAGTAAVVRLSLRLLAALGIAGGLLMAALTPWLVRDMLRISPALDADATAAFLILAASLPAVVLTSGYRGVLEAYHRFDIVNAIRAPLGVFTFAAPLALLPFTERLSLVIALLVAGRLAALAAHAIACVRVMPELRGAASAGRAEINGLLRAGGWMTVSNVVSPIMVTMDRFFIGALVSAAVVTYYTVPFEVASKILILPVAVAAPLFASFAATGDGARHAALMMRGMMLTCLVVLPCTLAVMLGARPGLTVWMGAAFALEATTALQVLVAGIFFNSLAQAPFALLQACGRARWTAFVHLVELPAYLVVAGVLISRFGVVGAAAAWGLRAAADFTVMTLLALRVAPGARRARREWGLMAAASAAVVAALAISVA